MIPEDRFIRKCHNFSFFYESVFWKFLKNCRLFNLSFFKKIVTRFANHCSPYSLTVSLAYIDRGRLQINVMTRRSDILECRHEQLTGRIVADDASPDWISNIEPRDDESTEHLFALVTCDLI